MEVVNKAITRGSGSTSIVFDVGAFASPIDAQTSDEVTFRIEYDKDPVLLKNSEAAHGNLEEIEIDEALDTYTIHLSESERNAIPDAGYSYKLYSNDALIAYGNITNSGAAPSGIEEVTVPWYNGSRERVLIGTSNAAATDDLVFGGVPNLVGWNYVLYEEKLTRGKIIYIKNTGSGTLVVQKPDLTTLVELSLGQSCRIFASTSNQAWIVLDQNG